MKRLIYAPVAAILIALMCSTSSMVDSVEGTWILVKGIIVTSEDTIKLPATENAVHMKIIGKTHFATLWQDPTVDNYAGFNGGTYTYENGIYTENLEFLSDKASIGMVVRFRVRLEKDKFFLESIAEEGQTPKYKIQEEWKRAD
jgi:hypothetical protein